MACISIPLAIGVAATVATTADAAVSGGPDLPSMPNYGTTESQTLDAQQQIASQLYKDTSNPDWGQPAYNQLQASTLNSLVNGNNGIPGTQAVTAAANTASRAADVADVTNLGPGAATAVDNLNPANGALLAGLNTSALAGLNAGSGLTPQQTRDMQQASRAAYAARGTGGSNSSIDDELLNQFSLGQQLLQQRQQFAQSLVGTNSGATTMPALGLITGNSTALPLALQSESQSGPTLFNPAAGNNLAASNYTTGVNAALGQQSPLQQAAGATTALGNLAAGAGSAYRGYGSYAAAGAGGGGIYTGFGAGLDGVAG